MKKYFVSYAQAVALKELGFDEECFNRFYVKLNSKVFGIDEHGRSYPVKNTRRKLYTLGDHAVLNKENVILAPLKSQVFEWFLKEHKLYFRPDYYDQLREYDFQGNIHRLGEYSCVANIDNFKTFEEAESTAIDKLIKLVKDECLILKRM